LTSCYILVLSVYGNSAVITGANDMSKQAKATEQGPMVSMIESVKAAVSADVKVNNAWKKAGESVASFYVTPEAFEAVKAQFCADAIIPALPKADRDILATKLPRKGTDEANAMPDWQTKIDALASARGKVASYFSRLRKYAFPKPVEANGADEAGEGEGKVASGLTAAKFAERVATLIKQVQAAESLDGVNVPDALKGLQIALASIKA
jgi:hypothetical protein